MWIRALSIAMSMTGLCAAQLEPPEIGKTPPPLQIERALRAPDGAQCGWPDLRGKVVVLEFFATWCAGCVAALPHVNRLVEALDATSFQYLIVNNQPRDVIEKFLEDHEVKPWVLLDDGGKTSARYSPGQYPMACVIDLNGTVVAVTDPRKITEADWDSKPSGSGARCDRFS